MTKKQRKKLSERMKLDNPMFRPEVKLKSSFSHRGKLAWNKGLKLNPLSKERKKQNSEFMKAYRKNHPNPMKNPLVRAKMSKTRKERFKNGELSVPLSVRVSSRKRMAENRKNEEFNKKMFKALRKSFSIPHQKVKYFLENNFPNQFHTNYSFKFGRTWGSIDEANLKNKIAIFIDGEYWHNYPNGRPWDKLCTTVLKNRGWKVTRIWALEVDKFIEEIEKNKICRDWRFLLR